MAKLGKAIEHRLASGKTRRGFVYLIGSKYGYKIGRTKTIRRNIIGLGIKFVDHQLIRILGCRIRCILGIRSIC